MKNARYVVLEIVLVAFIIVGIFIVGNYFFFRIDLTSERRYSLGEYTRLLLSELNDHVYLVLYMGGDLPPEFRFLRDEVKYSLEEYRAFGGKYFNYEILDPHKIAPTPQKLRSLFQKLTEKGLNVNSFPYYEGGESRQVYVITGGFVRYGMDEVPVDFLKSPNATNPYAGLTRSVSQIEYEMTSALVKLLKKKFCKVGLLRYKCSLSDLEINGFEEIVSSMYEYKRVRIEDVRDDRALSVLCIMSPDSQFTDYEKIIIDQFVMRGGSLLVCVDGVDANMDSLARNNTMLMGIKSHGLEDILMSYGIKVENAVVEDMNCLPVPVIVGNVGGRPITEMIPWRFFPVMMPHEGKGGHPLVRNLDIVLFRFPSVVDTIRREGVSHYPLFSSSMYSRVVRAPNIVDINVMRRNPDPALFSSRDIPVAVLSHGRFKSAFSKYKAFYSFGMELRDSSIKETNIIVIGDGNVFANQVIWSSRKPLPLGYDRYTGRMMGNAQFLASTIQYLCGDTELVYLKNKEFRIRPLNKILVSQKKEIIQMANTVFPVLIGVLFASGMFLYRRKWKKK